jgi:hypothetical protein
MWGSAGHRPSDVLYPGRVSTAVALGACVVAWAITVSGIVTAVTIDAHLGWARAVVLAVVCGSLPVALWATRRMAAQRRIIAAAPDALLRRRYHGSFDRIADSPRRRLRPIGATATEVAVLTELLLAKLLADSTVRIFRGVAAGDADEPPVAHALAAGRSIVLIESVTWPPGSYSTDLDGRVRCDNVVIGQSVEPLVGAVRQWRRTLPRTHRVAAVVVVHPTDAGPYDLPRDSPDVVFTLGDDAVRTFRQYVPSRPHMSRTAIAALAAATVIGLSAGASPTHPKELP